MTAPTKKRVNSREEGQCGERARASSLASQPTPTLRWR